MDIPRDPINHVPALVQIMDWHRPGDKPSSKPIMNSLLTHIYMHHSASMSSESSSESSYKHAAVGNRKWYLPAECNIIQRWKGTYHNNVWVTIRYVYADVYSLLLYWTVMWRHLTEISNNKNRGKVKNTTTRKCIMMKNKQFLFYFLWLHGN